MFAYVCTFMYAMVHIQRSEANSWDAVFISLCVGHQDGTQHVGLSSQLLYLLSYLTGMKF